MKVCINGTEQILQEAATLTDALELFQLSKKSIVVELNRQVVDRNLYAVTHLAENDTLEIVHFVGGG